MSYKDKWELAVNQSNIDLVMMAMVDVSLELLADPATDAQVAAYAASALNNPQSYAKRLTVGVVHEATGISDADVKAAVQAVLPYYAGLQATE